MSTAIQFKARNDSFAEILSGQQRIQANENKQTIMFVDIFWV